MKIESVSVKEIKDSRGEPTIEIFVGVGGELFSAKIPSGKSRGKNEAAVLNSKDAERILEEVIAPEIVGKNLFSISELDGTLLALDGTPDKSKIGGNLALGISVAFWRALAASRGAELWEVLKEEFFAGDSDSAPPFIFSNLINGGAHARNNLDIQEYMVVVDTNTAIRGAVAKLKDFFKKLTKPILEANGGKKLRFGDEGGYSLDFKDNFAPIGILESLIKNEGLEQEFGIALDVAASGFYGGGKYIFGGKALSSAEFSEIYADYFASSPSLCSIEDPFAETDYDGFKNLIAKFPERLIVGDDLTVTNPDLIKKFAEERLINGVIIKPNQVGTLTETCMAMRAAKERGVKCIVSHRSGETEDAFIIHLARAGNAYGVKIGVPSHPERIAKFEELLRIY